MIRCNPHARTVRNRLTDFPLLRKLQAYVREMEKTSTLKRRKQCKHEYE